MYPRPIYDLTDMPMKGRRFEGLIPVYGDFDMPQGEFDPRLNGMDEIDYGQTRTVYNWNASTVLKVDRGLNGQEIYTREEIERYLIDRNTSCYDEASLWVANRDGYRGHLLTPVLAVAASGKAILMRREDVRPFSSVYPRYRHQSWIAEEFCLGDIDFYKNVVLVPDDFGNGFAGRTLDYSR